MRSLTTCRALLLSIHTDATTKQVAADENGYLRRRLEAIERTTLKLNLGGTGDDIRVLRERLELESEEVLRLRETVDTLQTEKLAISEVCCLVESKHFFLDP